MKDTCLIGYGGHGITVADTYLSTGGKLKYYLDREPTKKNPFNLIYAGNEGDKSNDFLNELIDYIPGIGDNGIRTKAAKILRKKGREVLTVIHSSAIISKSILLGKGVFIGKNVCINPMAKISDDVIINTSAVIEHDCIINFGAQIGPGVVLCGNVHIGNYSFVGANSVIKPGISIGENVIIGAGSVVVKDIPNQAIVFGNPAH